MPQDEPKLNEFGEVTLDEASEFKQVSEEKVGLSSIAESRERVPQYAEPERPKSSGPVLPKGDLLALVSNPEALINELSLTPSQEKNLRSLVVGGGTGAVHRLLADAIGDIPASIAGAAIASYLLKKLTRR